MNNSSRISLVMAAIAAMTIAIAGCAGKKQESAGTAPAAVFKVTIVPETPDPATPLSIAIEPMDSGLRYQVQWLVNNRPSGTTINTDFFSSRFTPGDWVRAKVTAFAGDQASGTAESQQVTVTEATPVIDSIALDPFPVSTAASALTVVPRLKVGGPATTFRCRWLIQGVRLPDSGLTVAVTGLKAGQIIFVEATPVSGVSVGKPMHINTTVLNGPPVLNGISFVSQDSSGYRYQVDAVDRDGDPISYQLMSRVDGVRLDPATGALYLAPGVRRTTITIRATDGRGSWVEEQVAVGQ